MSEKSDKIAIVAVGYNRPNAMGRLLKSILLSEFNEDEVDLIISIDKGEKQNEIIKVADEIQWLHGKKVIKAREERLGLKRHIISCGDLSEDYKAVVVLEDDLTVSRFFYQYVKSAIRFYEHNSAIAGISLYSYQIIPYSSKHFFPENNGYDSYLMQVAMSWGQCWTSKMWAGFKAWYQKHDSSILDDGCLPESVVRWDDRSWLKYYDRYLVESEKYFVMPYTSLSTNHTESGEHAVNSTTMFEVPLLSGPKHYCFPSVDDAVKYDAFFERKDMEYHTILGLESSVLMDLNGIRTKIPKNANYLASTNIWPYECIKEYGLVLRPIESNLAECTHGKGILIYNTRNIGTKRKKGNQLDKYDLFDAEWRQTLRYSIRFILERLKEKLYKYVE